MRSSIFIAAPFLAAAYAQNATETITSNGVLITSTYTYTNGYTSFLTQTNSLGVVTGRPSQATEQATLPAGVTTQPAVITTQPEVATIPAGLQPGVTSLGLNISGTESYFTVSVGSSTTAVIGGADAGASVTTGASAGISTGGSGGGAVTYGLGSSGVGLATATSGSGSSATGGSSADAASATGGSSATASSSGADTSDSAAMSNVRLASGGLVGLGALFAALL